MDPRAAYHRAAPEVLYVSKPSSLPKGTLYQVAPKQVMLIINVIQSLLQGAPKSLALFHGTGVGEELILALSAEQ